jgi:2-polyprenyl-6-methoxyphenol hydroxylase-like FAD-dependent oxidoreductase
VAPSAGLAGGSRHRDCGELTLLRDTHVVAVRADDQDGNGAVVTAAGTTFPADLVIGAVSARSTVRAAVDPERPDGRYAGVTG